MDELRKYVNKLFDLEKRFDHVFITYGHDYAFTNAHQVFD